MWKTKVIGSLPVDHKTEGDKLAENEKALSQRHYDFIYGMVVMRDDVCGFMFNGYYITNPFEDEKEMNDVDPVQYYGKAFVESEFVEEAIRHIGFLRRKSD